MLFVSNSFFIPYAKASMYFGGVFLIVQAVSQIDAFYLWAEFWANKFDEGNNSYGCLLIFTILMIYVTTRYFIYSGLANFSISGCYGNLIILIIALVCTVAFIVLIILRFHPKGSIITSGAISIFWSISFLVFPDKQSIGFLQSNKRHQNLHDIPDNFQFSIRIQL